MINYLFIIIFSFILTVKSVTIQNENDFIEKLSSTQNEINLTIDTDITITKNITLPITLKKLSLVGSLNKESIPSSKLIFNNLLYFNDNIKTIELKNIEISGTLFFNNNKQILLDNVILNGSIDTDMDNQSNEYFQFNKVIYRPIENMEYAHCISIIGNVDITNSEFYGSSSCQDRLLNYDGLNKYRIKIMNSKFSGEYQCSCMEITQFKKSRIEYSTFEKGFSGKGMNGG